MQVLTTEKKMNVQLRSINAILKTEMHLYCITFKKRKETIFRKCYYVTSGDLAENLYIYYILSYCNRAHVLKLTLSTKYNR